MSAYQKKNEIIAQYPWVNPDEIEAIHKEWSRDFDVFAGVWTRPTFYADGYRVKFAFDGTIDLVYIKPEIVFNPPLAMRNAGNGAFDFNSYYNSLNEYDKHQQFNQLWEIKVKKNQWVPRKHLPFYAKIRCFPASGDLSLSMHGDKST